MSLILGLHEGDEFVVGPDKFTVLEIGGKFRFRLRRGDGREFSVTHRCSVEIADDVFVTAGSHPQNYVARLAIDAPRELRITRPNFRSEAS
jgi:hypothetical protein